MMSTFGRAGLASGTQKALEQSAALSSSEKRRRNTGILSNGVQPTKLLRADILCLWCPVRDAEHGGVTCHSRLVRQGQTRAGLLFQHFLQQWVHGFGPCFVGLLGKVHAV